MTMDWSFLFFLAQPWFVIPWYAFGLGAAMFVAWDVATRNTPLKKAMKWAWPIIVLFFSPIGLALYLLTARAPGIGTLQSDDEKQQAHDRYERNMFRRINGAVIHCVAGDCLGIMTGMVIARALRMTFWQEFWFEYAMGFAFGWFIFQYRSMKMMTDSTAKALAMAFRAEFFSMMTVMAGMGTVMAYVTPEVVTAQPRPLTYAFWGFGMLGLLVGYVFTYPMNAMIVKVGWKHGMGSKEDAHPVQSPAAKWGLVTAMVVLGVGALLVPGIVFEVRRHERVEVPPVTEGPAVARLADGLHETLERAADGETKMSTIEAAHRAAKVGDEAAPQAGFAPVLDRVSQARHALWMGRRSAAHDELREAARLARQVTPEQARAARLDDYRHAIVVDARGQEVGKVVGVHGDRVAIARGGIRNFWGFIDLGTETIEVPASALVLGPSQTVGRTFVMLADDPLRK
jgi:hypothetical protein